VQLIKYNEISKQITIDCQEIYFRFCRLVFRNSSEGGVGGDTGPLICSLALPFGHISMQETQRYLVGWGVRVVEYGAFVEWQLTGENRNTRRRSYGSASHSVHQKSHINCLWTEPCLLRWETKPNRLSYAQLTLLIMRTDGPVSLHKPEPCNRSTVMSASTQWTRVFTLRLLQ
jgi:hypothetical protein